MSPTPKSQVVTCNNKTISLILLYPMYTNARVTKSRTWYSALDYVFGGPVLAIQASLSTFIRIVFTAATCVNGAFATKVAVTILHCGGSKFFCATIKRR